MPREITQIKPEHIIVDILSQVIDQNLKLNAKEMGLVPEINVHDNRIDLILHAGFPTYTLEQGFLSLLTEKIKQALPDYTITMSLQSAIPAQPTQMQGKALRGVKNTIAIASGKGGVGKSTVTVNLATALSLAGAKVGILDADIYGPSIPLMLGTPIPVSVKDNHYIPATAHGVQAMSIGYLTDNHEALIWRGPMLAKALIQMLDLTLWDDLDYLFIDLPPGTGDIQLSLVQKIPLTGAIVVTTPQQVATLDAEKAIKLFTRTNIHVLGIIENMALHKCQQCGHEDAIFGHGGAEALCESFSVPLLGQLPLDKHIQVLSDSGKPSSLGHDLIAEAFMNAAMHVAIRLAT